MLKPKIHRLAREAIRRLKDDRIEPTLDEIVWLHNLAEKTEKVADPELLLFQCKRVGNINIYPMTIGARVWMLNVALKWFDGDDLLTDLSILYAYANSRKKNSFNFETPKAARSTILKWANKITATEDEITNAFQKITPDNDEDDLRGYGIVSDLIDQIKTNPISLNLEKAMKYIKKDASGGIGHKEKAWAIPYISMLMHYYPGKTESQWLWETAEELSFEMIQKISEFEKGDDDKPDMKDPSILAFNEFQKALTYIRKCHSVNKG